jgi:hypothetical protein
VGVEVDFHKNATGQVIQVDAVLFLPSSGQEGALVEDVHKLALVGQGVELIEGHASKLVSSQHITNWPSGSGGCRLQLAVQRLPTVVSSNRLK